MTIKKVAITVILGDDLLKGGYFNILTFSS